MSADDAIAAPATDDRLLETERDGRPAFVVDSAGDVVWSGAAGRRLIETGLDPATRRILARMASAGSGGLMRLRLGALGRLVPIAFRARPLGDRLLALEGLSPIAQPASVPDGVASPRQESSDATREQETVAGFAASPVLEASEVDPAPAIETASPPTTADPEPFRFAFEIDSRRRITVLSPEFGRSVGASAAAALGRTWDDVAAELELDGDKAVAGAIAGRTSWGEIVVSWPLDDGRRLPVGLSALPMFDSGRTFVGYRGLGRSLGAPAMRIPASPPDEAPAAAPETAPAAEPDPTPIPEVAQEIVDEVVRAVAAETDPAPQTPRDEPPAIVEVAPPVPPPLPHNVVPLREGGAARALSSNEESAFDEIARRLRAAGVAAVERAGAAAAAKSSEPAAAQRGSRRPAATPRADELSRLLDRLPVGALALRGGELIFANRFALDLYAVKDVAELSARGADTLFAAPLPRNPDAASAPTRLIAADGDEIEVDATISTVTWGGAPATLVSLRPAADSAAAEAALARESEIAAMLDVASDGVMTLDGQGRILSLNRGAESLFGFEGRDAVGSLFTLSLAPESRRAAFDYLDHLKTGTVPPLSKDGREVLGLSRQGGAIPLFMTIGRLGSPEADRYCVMLRDVTPYKRAEDDLVAARRQAERANAQKSEFLTKVSHEIRSPLNAIIGFAELMMEERFGPIGNPRYKDYLRDIQSSGEHLISLVSDLMDLTKIESGRMKLDFAPVDLNEIASQAAALLQPQAARGRVIIRTSLARGLPPVLADRRSIRQVMTNLASNAVKLSRPGGQVIVATALTDVGQAVFRVRDAGAGMTQQEIARAFEPFRPLSVADNDAGEALGLPLTKALAEANEAALALQSEPGQGTLAEVTFPASRVLAG